MSGKYASTNPGDMTVQEPALTSVLDRMFGEIPMTPVRDTSNNLNMASRRIEIMSVIIRIWLLWPASYEVLVLAQKALLVPFPVFSPCLQVRVMGYCLIGGHLNVVREGQPRVSFEFAVLAFLNFILVPCQYDVVESRRATYPAFNEMLSDIEDARADNGHMNIMPRLLKTRPFRVVVPQSE
jgi:hypothetical protein